MSLSLRWRLTIGIAAALIATLAAILITLRLALGGILEADLDRELEGDARLVSGRVAVELGSLEDEERLQGIVDSFSLGEPGSAFVVVIRDREGQVLASTPGLAAGDFAMTVDEINDLVRERTGPTSISRTVKVANGDEVRLRASRLRIGAEVVGIVQVAEDAEPTETALGHLQTILLLEGLGGVVLALLIGYWLARGAVKPMQEVISVAADIEASDLSRRIGAKRSPAEVQKLADTFDAMLERLDVAFQKQRNFVLDISHELRTPLAALRGNIDVLLMDDSLDGETRAALERMSREASRLIRLTSNILYLAHAEAGRELDRRPVELDTLCLEVYRQTKDLRPDIKYRLGNEDQVTVIGDRDLLKQVLLNLVDNSLKYTPAGGEVTLSLYRDDAHARLEVRDTGPGMEPDQIPLIFQRFYRGQSGKKRDRGGGGAGIGLAISDWIVKAHGGEIVVTSQPGRGSLFTVRLPLDGQPA
jgi:two-component system OmpR family sensor kinase